MSFKIAKSTGDFQRRWNVLSLSFSERESLKCPQRDFYHNYLINNECLQHSGIDLQHLIKVTVSDFGD